MDQIQTNRVTMFKTVTAYLDQNNSVWSSGKSDKTESVVHYRTRSGSDGIMLSS